MRECIWTRQRKLNEYEEGVLQNLRTNTKIMVTALDNDNWVIASIHANAIATDTVRMQEIERELENVDALCNGWERIEKRMDALEKQCGIDENVRRQREAMS